MKNKIPREKSSSDHIKNNRLLKEITFIKLFGRYII